MFKLESYVTPLILSYVDKYIKNLKPEDSQLSLWGGDAVFTNLDLRLDVLEQELNLPFSFINGHIHELRIHVPWTRLGSEPVVITINTIECILKLRNEDDSGSDGSTKSSLSLAAQKNRQDSTARRKLRRQEGEELPPGYIQSLVNRVVNNISVVCNNLILKYVEDDIVLSLNIKSAELFSVDEDWQRSFIDLNPECPVLRKVISMQDLTVCLDKRDASGKIEIYQDPLLYRCSASCRIYMRYDNPHATARNVTRINLFCDSLDFSITDQQLPMFLRLVQLCLALYYNEFGETSKVKRNSQELSLDEVSPSDQQEGLFGEGASSGEMGWGTWVWSYVPQILPDWTEDDLDDETRQSRMSASQPHLFQFGVFVDKATCIFKLTENVREAPLYFGQSKLSFQPLAAFYLQGAAVEITTKNADFVHVQMGVTSISLSAMGECICGVGSMTDSQSEKVHDVVFKSGALLLEKPVRNFHLSSLFDPHAPENVSQQREYNFDWEKHLAKWTEKSMLHKYPAVAIDYIYELEIPEEWSDRASSITATFLENSNWHERAFFRMVFGQSITDITSSFVHRLQKFLHCAQQHEYPPYSSTKPEMGEPLKSPPTIEDIESLEEFVPSRTYHLTLIKPMIRMHLSNHPAVDVSKAQFPERKKRKRHKSKQGSGMSSLMSISSYETPVITLFGDCVAMQISKPMYPQRLIKITSALTAPPSNLLHRCHVHLSVKLFGFEIFLSTTSHIYMEGLSVLPACSMAFFKKSLLLVGSWQSHPKQIIQESWVEIPKFAVHLTKPQLLSLVLLGKSWWENKPIQQDIVLMLTKDMLDKEKPVLFFELKELECHYVENSGVIGCSGSVNSVTCGILSKSQKVVLLHAPEHGSVVQKDFLLRKVHDTESNINPVLHKNAPAENWLEFTVQLLKDLSVASEPSMLLVQLCHSAVCLDLSLLTWLSYHPPANPFSTVATSLFKQTEVEVKDKDVTGDTTSTTTPSYGQTASQSVPVSPLASTWEKMKGSSSESDADYQGQWATYLFYYSRLFVIQVNVDSCNLFIPSTPWAVPFPPSSLGDNVALLPYWQEAISKGSVKEAVIICLPKIKVTSAGSKNNDLPVKPELPVPNIEGWIAGTEKFPWNITLQDVSIYTLHMGSVCDAHYILRPSTVSSTLGVTTKCSAMTADLSQLGVCIHADFQPLFVSCSQKQISLLMDILVQLLGAAHTIRKTLNFIHSIGEGPKSLPTGMVPIVPLFSVVPNQFSHTSSSQIEAGHDYVSEMPDTSEQITLQQGSSSKTKVTLWLQVTLPKLGVSLLGKEAEEEIKIEMEIEDFMTSLDVQEVYSKVKAKFNSMNVHCFQKRTKDTGWNRSPAEGIIFSCGQKLTPHIFITRPKSPDLHHSGSASTALDCRTKGTDSFSHAFLNFTYTRALVTNVQKKWAAFVKEHTPSSGDDDPTPADEKQNLSCPEKYISEIELKLNSFDIVLLCPLVRIIYNIFLPLQNVYMLLSQRKWQAVTSSTIHVPKFWNFNHNNLPLVYLNTSNIRIFMPEVSPSLKEALEHKYTTKTSKHSSDSPDTCILQIGSITLVPQAENPLSRIVLRRDLYLAAQRSRTIGIPGAAIEDRQYQLDVSSLSFSTTSWNDIIHHSRERLHSPPPKLSTLGENPALEWNNKIIPDDKQSDEEEIVSAVPVMSQFDMKVLVAPAVVYRKLVDHQRKQPEEILVCGHSMEVNVTSDFDIYLSLHQLHLIHRLWTKNLLEIFTVPEREQKTLEEGFSHLMPRMSLSDFIRDSGIDSEDTTVRLASSQNPLSFFVLKSGLPAGGERKMPKTFVPFEILITGCSVSLTLYHNDVSLIPPRKLLNRSRAGKKKCYRRSQNSLHTSQPTAPDSEECSELVTSTKYLPKSPRSVQRKKRKRQTVQTDDASSQSSHCHATKSAETSSTCTFTGLFSEEAGYDGSEDSFSEVELKLKENDKNGNETGKSRAGQSRVIPCIYMCISQPHTFISCHSSKQKIETSCFDIQVKGAHYAALEDIPVLPSPNDFTTSWILTRPGEVHPKTGIPPALVTLTVMDFLHRPAVIKLQLERPAKVNLTISMIDQLTTLYKTACSLLSSTVSQSGNKLSETNIQESPKQEACPEEPDSKVKNYVATLKNNLQNISKLEISTVQTMLAFESSPDYNCTRLCLSANSVKGDISIMFESSGEVKEVSTSLDIQGLFLKIGSPDHMHRFIGPFSFEVAGKALWETWHICSPIPAIQLRLNGEVLYINLSPEQIKHFRIITKRVQDLLMGSHQEESTKKTTENIQSKKHRASKTKTKDFYAQEFFDDLRKGTFQYIQDQGSGIQAKPYDIVFCKDLGTMTWCYPQPRALTRVEVLPVPFHPSSINSFSSKEVKSPPVQCSLQYWDVMKNRFITCCQFYLSENSSTSLDMPLVTKETCHLLAVSDLWRVVLNCKFGDFILDDSEPSDIGVLSPMALAACMKIDSCFDPVLLPSIQASVSINLCQITFGGKLHGKVTPSRLGPFSIDDRLPRDQEFGHFTIENPLLTFQSWYRKWKGEVTLNIGCDLMEYRCLTMHPVIEPVDIQGSVIFSTVNNKTPVLDSAIVVHPLFLNINQSTLHTVNIISQTWLQSPKEDEALIIPQHYIICNNTDQTFCFGQVGTDESIVLVSQRLHAYSWRSHKAVQMIRISLRVMGQKWCDPFEIDSPGTITRIVTHRGVSSTLVIKVIQISSVQFQIIVFGQFLVSNRLTQTLEVQLLARRVLKPFKVLSLVEPMSVLPGFVVDLSRIVAIRIRLHGIDTPWSEDVTITGDAQPPHLVKIPLKGSNQYLSSWCEFTIRNVLDNVKYCIVTFSSPFVIRNHLPRTLLAHLAVSDETESYCIEVSGKGRDHHLVTFSDIEKMHKLCFQMGPGMKMSSPPIDLSTAILKDMEREDVSSDINDANELYGQQLPAQSLCWPYDDNDLMRDVTLLKTQGFLMGDNIKKAMNTTMKPEAQLPDIELKVHLSLLNPQSNTLLIDVKPSSLLVNRTGCDLYLVENNGHEWKIPTGSTFTPSNLQDIFYLGVIWSGELYLSEPLQSSNDDWTIYRTHPKVKGILPRVGRTNVAIFIRHDNGSTMCSLLVNVQEQEGIRIVTVFPAFCISNHTGKADPSILLSAVPESSHKCRPPTTQRAVSKVKLSPGSAIQPLLFWDILPNDKSSELDDLLEFQYYIQFNSKSSSETSNASAICSSLTSFPISQPVCLSKPSNPDSRHTVSVPQLRYPDHSEPAWCSKPLVLTQHMRNGISYLTVSVDPFPMLKIYNGTNFILLFGESVEHSEKGKTVFEEKTWHGFLPCVPPSSEMYYSFPSLSVKFPNNGFDGLPMIHLAQQPSKSDPDYELLEFWSVPVDTRSVNDQFIYIPDAGDVKIHKERVGHTLHVFVDPVSRVEVSAKEIRSRIGTSARSYAPPLGNLPTCEDIGDTFRKQSKEEIEIGEDALLLSATKIPMQKKGKETHSSSSLKPKEGWNSMVVYSSVTFSHICAIMCDVTQSPSMSKEIVRVNFDNILWNFRPGALNLHTQRVGSHGIFHSQHELTICIGAVQIDNQMAVEKANSFDFQVIFTQQQNPATSKVESPQELSSSAWLSKAKSSSTITIEAILENIQSSFEHSNRFVIIKLDLTIRPLSLFLEDAFCYSINDLRSPLFPVSLHKPVKLQPIDLYLPDDVSNIAKTLVHPIRIQQFHIAPLFMLVSLHASLKIYLSLDNSPLDFMAYEQQEVFTTSYRFGQLLTIHYLSGALLRAGWVVGSLDLIGNPTGLVRAIKSGISDFIFLPYHGLFRGPRAFVMGIAHGTISLLRQISSGTLRSLTNLATSVSRNMDRLSLDSDHWSRQEELRRQHPQGVTSGIGQGLSSFGISLLGAVAGIVDQPMRTLVSQSGSDVATGMRAAELVAGVGKGLVGVVTKPIGGAAELVSQTGHGLLHGAGWGRKLTPRYNATSLQLSDNCSSNQRLMSKVFYGLSSSEALMCIEVTCQNPTGNYVTNILFLTPDVLCVASKSEDIHQQTFLVTEVNCYGSETDRSVITLVSRQKPGSLPLEEHDETKDRIAEYIQQYSGTTSWPAPDTLDEATASLEGQTFYVHPKLRNMFIMLFDMAQKRAHGRGFAI